MTLLDEIRAKCTPAQIADRNYHVIAEAVSAGRVKTVPTPIADVQAYLQSTGVWWTIKAAANNPAHPAQAAAEAVMDVATARYDNLNMSLPIVAQMYGGLQASGLITSDQQTYLLAMGTTPDPVTWQACNEAVDAGV